MATKRWISGVSPTFDLWTLTLSGTVTSQTYTLTVGNQTIAVVAGGGDTVATIFLALYAAYISTTSPVAQEFKELTPALDNTTTPTQMTLTGTVRGVPHTVSFTSGGAATIAATNTTVAVGPNFFNVGGNWSGGVAPANGDVLYFDSGNVECKYGLNSTLTTVTVNVTAGYSGKIGLPDRNADAASYTEYRTTSLTLDGGTLVVNAPSVNLCRLNFGSTLATIRVLDSGPGINGTPAVLVRGGAASSELDLTKGSVGCAIYAGESFNLPTVKQSYLDNQQSDSRLVLGVGGSTVTALTKTGGILESNVAVTTFTQGIAGGSSTFLAGAVGTLNANGGEVDYRSASTITTLNLHNDADVSFDADPRALTVTNAITMTGRNCKISDGAKRINSGVLTLTMTDATLDQVYHGTSNGAVIT